MEETRSRKKKIKPKKKNKTQKKVESKKKKLNEKKREIVLTISNYEGGKNNLVTPE